MQEILITELAEIRNNRLFLAYTYDYDRGISLMVEDYLNLPPEARKEITELTAMEYRLLLPDHYDIPSALMLADDLNSGRVRAKGYKFMLDFLPEACVRKEDLLARATKIEQANAPE